VRGEFTPAEIVYIFQRFVLIRYTKGKNKEVFFQVGLSLIKGGNIFLDFLVSRTGVAIFNGMRLEQK
jgi:hypothetical protein